MTAVAAPTRPHARGSALASASVLAALLPSTRPDEEWFQYDPAVRLEASQVARELDCDEIIAARLVMRGLSAQEVTDYLNPGPQHIRPPEETVAGMDEAAAALARGVADGDVVAIYGDYDVDGQTSLAIITDTLEQYGARTHAGSANATSGFGLTRAFVEEAHAAGAKWLITVDCGSTQTQPIKLAQSLGMRVIVIDHHDVDSSNTCEYHLNPRVRAVEALENIHKAMRGMDEIRQRKWMPTQPYADALDKLTPRSVELLREYFGDNEYEQMCEDVRRFGHPTNTGSMLTWKFASAFHLIQGERTPSTHWGRPLYLAGLGAIADMAPCDDQEVRAFVRVPCDKDLQRDHFRNRGVIPKGIRMIADTLEEDAERPADLVRTRALLNLPKRTSEIDPNDIQTLLRSDNAAEIAALTPRIIADYERLSAIRRERMDPLAMAQVQAASELAQITGEETFFNYVELAGFERYSGYARMVANNVARKTGKPALAFTRKGIDAYGQELWKFSGANDCVPEAKLGDLIADPEMIRACTIHATDWLGEEADLPNLGGHVEVVSGVCTTENIAKVKAACEAWAQECDHKKKWRPIDHKRPRVARRKVGAARLRRLEREAELLAPLKFPESPALQVSVLGRFSTPRLDAETNNVVATMTLDDGMQRKVILSEEVAAVVRAHRQQRFEAIIALGKVGPYYISRIAV